MSPQGTDRAFSSPVIQSRAGRLLVLFVLLLPLWWPIFVSGETFYTRDTANYFIPQKSMEVQSVRDGILPS